MFYECEPLECLLMQTPPPLSPQVAHLKQRPPDSYVPRCHWRGTRRLFFCCCWFDVHFKRRTSQCQCWFAMEILLFFHYSFLWKQNRLSSEWQVCFPVKIPTNSQPVMFCSLHQFDLVVVECSAFIPLSSFLRLVGSPVLSSIVYRNIDACQTNKQMTLYQGKWWGIH